MTRTVKVDKMNLKKGLIDNVIPIADFVLCSFVYTVYIYFWYPLIQYKYSFPTEKWFWQFKIKEISSLPEGRLRCFPSTPHTTLRISLNNTERWLLKGFTSYAVLFLTPKQPAALIGKSTSEREWWPHEWHFIYMGDFFWFSHWVFGYWIQNFSICM